MEFISTKVENKKTEILQKMAGYIYEHGMARFSLRGLARECKVSQPILHYYFGNKQNLLTEFVKYIISWIESDIERRYKESDPPEKKLEAFLDAGEDFIVRQEKLFTGFIECWAFSIRDKTLRRMFSNCYKSLYRFLESIVDEGIEKGVFNKVDMECFTATHLATVEGLCLQKHVFQKGSPFRRSYREHAEDIRKRLYKQYNSRRSL